MRSDNGFCSLSSVVLEQESNCGEFDYAAYRSKTRQGQGRVETMAGIGEKLARLNSS